MKQVFLNISLSSILVGLTFASGPQNDLQKKLSELAQVTDPIKRSELLVDIQDLQRQINSRTDQRDNLARQPQSTMLNRNNPNLHRDTYFYRGPVINQNFHSPFLDQSWQRSYGTDTRFSEGLPVFSINHPNPYVNQAPGFEPPLRRNPHINPVQNNSGSPVQMPGSQYLPPNYGYPPFGNFMPGFPPVSGFPGVGYPTPGMFPGNFFLPGFGRHPGMGYGPYPAATDQVTRDLQATNLAKYDAQMRLRNILRNDPKIVAGNQLNVEVLRVDRVENDQIQITMTTSGGVTGQGVGLQRIFLYSRDGAFARELQQPLIGTPGQTKQLERYRVSNQQKFQIERYLSERGLNPYGDPLGTMYAGGDPLMQAQDGTNDRETLRFNYILAKHPALVQYFAIQKQ